MATPKALIITGYGINCEEETAKCFQMSGAESEIVHINDLISGDKKMMDYQIMAFPGGFSYGDDTGSGNAFANKLKNHLYNDLLTFANEDKLIIGICNGCQIVANLGLIPALNNKYGERQIALMHNKTALYECRWIHMKNTSPQGIWTRNIDILHVPVAHGEGNFYMTDETFKQIKDNGQIAFQYVKPDGLAANEEYPHNPNGSMHDIAALTDTSGRIIGIMPHPERFNAFVNEEGWQLKKESLLREGKSLPKKGEGLKIFENATSYFA